jgi:hypothetical protein
MRNRIVDFTGWNNFCAVNSFVGALATGWVTSDQGNQQLLDDFNEFYDFDPKKNGKEFKKLLESVGKVNWPKLLSPVIIKKLQLKKDHKDFFGDTDYNKMATQYGVNIRVVDNRSAGLSVTSSFIEENKGDPKVSALFQREFTNNENIKKFIREKMMSVNGYTEEEITTCCDELDNEFPDGVSNIHALLRFFQQKAEPGDAAGIRTLDRLDGKYNSPGNQQLPQSCLVGALFDLVEDNFTEELRQFKAVFQLKSNSTKGDAFEEAKIMRDICEELEKTKTNFTADKLSAAVIEQFKLLNCEEMSYEGELTIKSACKKFIQVHKESYIDDDSKTMDDMTRPLQFFVQRLILGKDEFSERNKDQTGDESETMIEQVEASCDEEGSVVKFGSVDLYGSGSHFQAYLTEEEKRVVKGLTGDGVLSAAISQDESESNMYKSDDASKEEKAAAVSHNNNLVDRIVAGRKFQNKEAINNFYNKTKRKKPRGSRVKRRRKSDPSGTSEQIRASERRHSEGSRGSLDMGNQAEVADGGLIPTAVSTASSTDSSTDLSLYVFIEIKGITYINKDKRGTPYFRMKMSNKANQLIAKAAQQYFHTNPGSSIKLTNVANPEQVCQEILALSEAIGPIEFDEKTVNRLQAEGSLDKVNELVSAINKKHQSSLTAVSQQSSAIAVVGEGSVSIPGPIDLRGRVEANTSPSSRGGSGDQPGSNNKRRNSSPNRRRNSSP